MKAANKREAADKEITRNKAMLDRKTKTDLEMSQEESRRKNLVEELAQQVNIGGENALPSIVKTLSEFLSKF